MTLFVVDTDVLINASKNREPDRTWLLEQIRGGEPVSITVVSLAEFYSGARRGQNAKFDALLDLLPCLPMTSQVGVTAGGYRHDFARQGLSLTTADCLIAAVAYHSGATLVTHNANHYPMAGIRLLTP